MLAGRRGGRYPQDDCSCLSGALARRRCDQGLVRLERARELRPPPHRRREAPAAQAHHQDIHQLLVTEHGASGISYSTVRDYIAPRRPLLPPPAGVPSEPPGPYDDRMADEAGGHVPVTRRQWDERMSAWFERYAHPRWAAAEPYWGMWCIPQSRLPVLPADPAGAAAVELGCGSAYVSAWLARRGARPVGVDVSARQLATARRLQAEFGLRFPLVHADAEQAPLASACADLVVSEYGASLWCDPHRWIPEAARLLRPGGRLVFMAESTLARMCLPEKGPATERLVRDLFGLHQVLRRGNSGTAYLQFTLPHGEWIRLMGRCGLVAEDLIEVQVPPGAANNDFPEYPNEWVRRWPAEEVWFARRR